MHRCIAAHRTVTISRGNPTVRVEIFNQKPKKNDLKTGQALKFPHPLFDVSPSYPRGASSTRNPRNSMTPRHFRKSWRAAGCPRPGLWPRPDNPSCRRQTNRPRRSDRPPRAAERRAREKAARVERMAPCSPFLTMTYFGPSRWIFLAARNRLSSCVNCRASLSFRTKPSTRRSSLSRSGSAMFSHKSMVSATTNLGRRIWSRTWCCKLGAMLASRTNGDVAAGGRQERGEGFKDAQAPSPACGDYSY